MNNFRRGRGSSQEKEELGETGEAWQRQEKEEVVGDGKRLEEREVGACLLVILVMR